MPRQRPVPHQRAVAPQGQGHVHNRPLGPPLQRPAVQGAPLAQPAQAPVLGQRLGVLRRAHPLQVGRRGHQHPTAGVQQAGHQARVVLAPVAHRHVHPHRPHGVEGVRARQAQLHARVQGPELRQPGPQQPLSQVHGASHPQAALQRLTGAEQVLLPPIPGLQHLPAGLQEGQPLWGQAEAPGAALHQAGVGVRLQPLERCARRTRPQAHAAAGRAQAGGLGDGQKQPQVLQVHHYPPSVETLSNDTAHSGAQ